jgi:hypothetical protein
MILALSRLSSPRVGASRSRSDQHSRTERQGGTLAGTRASVAQVIGFKCARRSVLAPRHGCADIARRLNCAIPYWVASYTPAGTTTH